MLAATVFIFGGQSYGQGQQNAPASFDILAATSSEPATSSASAILSGFIQTLWGLPTHIFLNTETNISYFVGPVQGPLNLFLCQTNFQVPANLTVENTWSVTRIPR